MNKKMLAVTAVIALVTVALAAPLFARGDRQGRGARIERMFEKLDLSPEQREQVTAVLDEVRPAMRDLRSAMTDNRRALRSLEPTAADYETNLKAKADEQGNLVSQMVMLRGETRAKIAALLTEEQRQQWQQMHWERDHHSRKDVQ